MDNNNELNFENIIKNIKNEYFGIEFFSGTIDDILNSMLKDFDSSLDREFILDKIKLRIKEETKLDTRKVLDSYVKCNFNEEMSFDDVKNALLRLSSFLEDIGITKHRRVTDVYVEYLFDNYPIIREKINSLIESNVPIGESYKKLENFICAYHKFCYDEEYSPSRVRVIPNSLNLYKSELNASILSQEEINQLIKQYRNGDLSARDKIIESNLRLVVRIASNYFNSNIQILDLIQEGNISLMKAVDRYDESLGYKFSSYAAKIINRDIYEYIRENSSIIKIPPYAVSQVSKFRKAVSEFFEKNGRYPSFDEIEKITGVKRKVIFSFVGQMESIEDIDFFSEDKLISDCNVEEEVLSIDSNNRLIELLSANLSEQELNVIKMRTGYVTGVPMTNLEVSKVIGVSEQAISLIEKKVFAKISSFKDIEEFGDIVCDEENFRKRIKYLKTLSPQDRRKERFSIIAIDKK